MIFGFDFDNTQSLKQTNLIILEERHHQIKEFVPLLQREPLQHGFNAAGGGGAALGRAVVEHAGAQ